MPLTAWARRSVGAPVGVFAVDADSGEVRWRADTAPRPDTGKPPPSEFPVKPAVVSLGDKIVCTTKRPAVEARDLESGALVWQCELTDSDDPNALRATQPRALCVSNRTVWVATHGHRVMAVDAETGRLESEEALPGWGADIPSAIEPASDLAGPDAALVLGGLALIALVRR